MVKLSLSSPYPLCDACNLCSSGTLTDGAAPVKPTITVDIIGRSYLCFGRCAPPPSWDALPDIRLGFLDHAISLSLSQPLHSSLTCGRKVELTEWSAVFQSSPKFQITGTVGIVTHYSTTFCGQLADSFTPLVLSPDKNCYSILLNRPLCLTV